LPVEIDDISVGELAGLASSPPSSRSGTGAGLGLSALAEPSIAGFGIPKRSGTPEPWMRRLADDGLSYHYWNKLNGQMSWTIPEAEGAVKMGRNRALTGSSTASSDLFSSPDEDLAPTRLRSDSATSQSQRVQDRNHSKLEHVSDSEDSGLYSPDHGNSSSASGRSHNDQDLFGDEVVDRKPSVQLTVAEKIAQSLQQSLAPPPPDLISDLSHIAHNAIAAVVKKNQSLVGTSRRTEHDQLDNLIRVVVTAVRDLLYISAPPGHIPSSLIPRDARGRRETTASQTLLKPAQRKVTATLSKLVLSARAMEYDSGPAAHETAFRIESDAEELDHAILTFVVEVQRCQNERLGSVGAKRVQGCFSATYLGLGLVGAGCAGSWKGFGWVPLDDNDEAPQRILDAVVFSEFKMHMVSMQTRFEAFHSALKSIGDDCRECISISCCNLLFTYFQNNECGVQVVSSCPAFRHSYYSSPIFISLVTSTSTVSTLTRQTLSMLLCISKLSRGLAYSHARSKRWYKLYTMTQLRCFLLCSEFVISPAEPRDKTVICSTSI